MIHSTFVAGLLFAQGRIISLTERTVIREAFNGWEGGVVCDESVCSVYIPFMHLRAGCRKLYELHTAFNLEYECDPEDII